MFVQEEGIDGASSLACIPIKHPWIEEHKLDISSSNNLNQIENNLILNLIYIAESDVNDS